MIFIAKLTNTKEKQFNLNMRLGVAIVIISMFLASLNAKPSGTIFLNNDPMQNIGLYQGDIKLDEEELKIVMDPGKGVNYIPSGRGPWPNGVVPYMLDPAAGYTTQEIETIYSAMFIIQSRTKRNGISCIQFVPRTSEAIYLKIVNKDGCWSLGTGRQNTAGPQELSLMRPSTPSSGHCLHTGTVAHELIHALGFLHEQQRADRDGYITVNYENIADGSDDQFNKVTSNYNYYGQPFDVFSIMMYANNAFSKNGLPTIVAKNGQPLLHSSYKNDITDIDVNELRAFYQCK